MGRSASTRPPGRPKNEGKRTAIVDAARRLFVNDAYETVTMEQVAHAAGVAKMTVYSHFHDKEALFEAMVQANSDTMIAALPALPQSDGDPEEDLVAFGCAFLSVLLSKDVINSIHRHFEMFAKNRSLAERIYDAGPGRTRATLAAYLSVQVTPNLSAEERIHAASDLMSLWLGDLPLRLALGLAAPITQNEIKRRARRCTQLFLRAYA